MKSCTKQKVLLIATLVAVCWANRPAQPAVLLYDKRFKELPAEQQTMAALALRDLQLERHLPSAIPIEMKARRSNNVSSFRKHELKLIPIDINREKIQNLVLLTSYPNIKKTLNNNFAKEMDKNNPLWWLNIELPCSTGFRLTKPLRPAAEDLATLVLDRRTGHQSIVPARTLMCTPSQWEKQTVIVGTVEMPPFSIRNVVNGTGKYNGSTIELFEALAGSGSFQYRMVEPADLSYGIPGNATLGLIGMGLRKEIDIAVCANPYGSPSAFDYIWPTGYGPWVAVIPSPMMLYDLLSNAKPFSFEVWAYIISSILAVSVVMHLVARSKTERTDFGLDVMYNIALITGQGGVNPNYLPARFLATAWNLAAFIIVFSYTSILISFVTTRRPEPLIRNLEDFVTKETLKPVAMRGYVFSTAFLTAESGYHKQIGNIFRQNSETLVDRPIDAINMVIGGRYGFITGTRMGETWVRLDYLKSQKCRMTTLEVQGSAFTMNGWNAAKHAPALTRKLRTGILKAIEGGLFRYYDRKYVPRIACFSMSRLLSEQQTREEPLILIQLQTAFLILGIGIATAFLSFGYEIIMKPKLQQVKQTIKAT